MVMTPVVPAYAVDRPLLRRRLDQGLTRPLTLVVAPAGSGKSVLLSQWAATRPDLAFVWLQLEPADDDPVRFAQRLLRGLAAISPAFAELAPLASMSGRGLGAPLIERLEPLTVELPDVVLVLDDLHHLSNPELVANLARFFEAMAPQVHLVLSTRIDPPLAWNHYRLNRHVTEIRQSDLAFSHADSAELLERITGRPIGADGVTALLNRTEGWAAGLQLAGVTLRTHADAEDFIVRFTGDDRLVADYLSEEVLNAQPERRRALLLQSAVLDQMSAPLVEQVTGAPGAQLMLEELERESMFLVPLDSHREWFRFHHLFRDLLYFRLRAEDPTAEADLLRRAADWYLDRGDVVPAVEYLLRAGEWERAVDVIFSRGSEIFEKGEMSTVIRWIRQLPESVQATRWDVTLLLGALLVAEGQAVAAEDTLRKVTTGADAPYGARVCAQSLLAALAQWRSRPETSITTATRALQMLQNLDGAPVPRLLGLTDPDSLETLVTVSGGRAHFLAGHLSTAREWLERALATAGAGYSIWRVSALGSLALLDAWCGSILDAEVLAAEALGVARDVGVLAHPAVADAYFAMAFATLERGDPHRAAPSLREGLLRAEANRRTQLLWVGRVVSVELQAAKGHPDQAITTMTAAANGAGSPPPPVVAERLLALRCRLLRLGGSPDQSLLAVDGAGQPPPPVAAEVVGALLAVGQVDRARKVIEGSSTSTDPAMPLVELEWLLLRAWLADIEGATDDGRAHVTDAMLLAERHGLVEACVRAGPQVVRLIAGSAGHPTFRRAVLERARAVRGAPIGPGLSEPLTDRELEVLSYLPSRPTNTELAERCYVSINTIKSHIAHIYRKLDVDSRNAAIARARELGLL